MMLICWLICSYTYAVHADDTMSCHATGWRTAVHGLCVKFSDLGLFQWQLLSCSVAAASRPNG
jgi:hypothetical protein